MTVFKRLKRLKRLAATLLCAAALTASFAQTPDSRVRLNSVGFMPGFPKKASIAAEPGTVVVIRDASSASSGALVFNRVSVDTMTNSDTKETLRIADFSDFNEPGRYYLYVQGVGDSPAFTIGDDVFVEPYRTAMLGMYLWRCGTAVSASHNGASYSHAACHLNDGDTRYIGSTGTRDGKGGWHDAGDYNKYIVNSGVSVGLMLKAWEHFGFLLRDINLISVPNSGAIPAYLAEVKWNLDWVEKMQYTSDGKVSHKLSTLGFGGNIMPENESTTRYFAPWSTAATGSFVGMLAQAARIYAPYDKTLANRYLEKASLSYRRLMDTTFVAHTQEPFETGEYGSGGDADKRLWASAEMWETTGDPDALERLETRFRASANISSQLTWANVNTLAALTYLNSKRPERDPEIVQRMEAALISTADNLISFSERHGYNRNISLYNWGANGTVAGTAYVLHSAYLLTGEEKYRHAVQDVLSHLLGRNYYGRSFVTGVGHNPPRNPHDRTSVARGTPWPGRLIGGPHSDKGGAPANITNCPTDATCWFDVSADYWTNEVAINWNAAMIYALSAALPGSGTLPAPCYPGQPECDDVSVRHAAAARPAAAVKTTRVVRTRGGKIDIPPGAKVYRLDGKLVARRGFGDAKTPDLRSNGVYIIRIDNGIDARNPDNRR